MPDAPTITLAYGATPLTLDTSLLPADTTVLYPPPSHPCGDIDAALADALTHPVGSASLSKRAEKAHKICVLLPDKTRTCPRVQMLQALWTHLESSHAPRDVTYLVATGTHAGNSPEELQCADVARARGIRVVNHDARDDAHLTHVGMTSRGTPVTLNTAVVEADLCIVLGQIQPHYFAGATGGVKGVFPGCGGLESIRANHRLKSDPGARLGRFDDNGCRLDMEEAARMAGPAFLVNVVLDPCGAVIGAVAGDTVEAHRAGVTLGLPAWRVAAPGMEQGADIVVISTGLPMAGNLYQLCKLVPPACHLAAEGGHIIVAGECPGGVGGLAAVNEQIYEWGLRYYLPDGVRCTLVSGLPRADVERTFFAYAPDLGSALDTASADIRSRGREPVGCVLPSGGGLIPQRMPARDAIPG